MCHVRSWIASQETPNGLMSSRKTSIVSFPSMRCLCRGEDTGKLRLSGMFHVSDRGAADYVVCQPGAVLTVVCCDPVQAEGPVPCSQGVHAVPTGGGLLPGSGSHCCCVAHAHACGGMSPLPLTHTSSLFHSDMAAEDCSICSPDITVCLASAQDAFWGLVQICEKYLPGYYSPGLVSTNTLEPQKKSRTSWVLLSWTGSVRWNIDLRIHASVSTSTQTHRVSRNVTKLTTIAVPLQTSADLCRLQQLCLHHVPFPFMSRKWWRQCLMCYCSNICSLCCYRLK